jgi:hypothetical protein
MTLAKTQFQSSIPSSVTFHVKEEDHAKEDVPFESFVVNFQVQDPSTETLGISSPLQAQNLRYKFQI